MMRRRSLSLQAMQKYMVYLSGCRFQKIHTKLGFLMVTTAAIATSPVNASSLNEYPTAERVEYVVACIRDRKAPYFELLSKCACTLDRIAEGLSYDAFVSYRTDVLASSIGGERGGVLRDNEGVKDAVKKYRVIEKAAQNKCMLGPPN